MRSSSSKRTKVPHPISFASRHAFLGGNILRELRVLFRLAMPAAS